MGLEIEMVAGPSLLNGEMVGDGLWMKVAIERWRWMMELLYGCQRDREREVERE